MVQCDARIDAQQPRFLQEHRVADDLDEHRFAGPDVAGIAIGAQFADRTVDEVSQRGGGCAMKDLIVSSLRDGRRRCCYVRERTLGQRRVGDSGRGRSSQVFIVIRGRFCMCVRCSWITAIKCSPRWVATWKTLPGGVFSMLTAVSEATVLGASSS